MKLTFSLGVIITATLLSCLSRAQTCVAGLEETQYHCVYGVCSGYVYTYTPIDEWGNVNYTCSSVPCCGQYFTTCEVNGICDAVKKAGMSESVRKYLEELPVVSELLVADCKGHYAPFKPAAYRLNKPASLATLDDRLLR
jgi:hypothetical protein